MLIRAISVSICARNSSASARDASPAANLGVERFGFVAHEIGGGGGRVAVIGCGGAVRPEEGAAVLVRAQIAGEGGDVLAGDIAQPIDIRREILRLRIDHSIGTVGRDDPPIPAALADRAMMGQRIERALGGGDQFDPEAIEQRARAETVGLERGVDHIEIPIGIAGFEHLVQPEDLRENPIEPHPRRRTAEQVIILREASPDRARACLDRFTVEPGYPQFFERDTLAVEHPENVMIWHDQQLRRIGELRVRREPGGIGMPVRAQDGQVPDSIVEPPRDRASVLFGREEAIGMKDESCHGAFVTDTRCSVIHSGTLHNRFVPERDAVIAR